MPDRTLGKILQVTLIVACQSVGVKGRVVTMTSFLRRNLGTIISVLLLATIGSARAQLADTVAPPTIKIASPHDGAAFKAPANIPIKVSGTDVPNTGHVISLYEDGTLLQRLILDPLSPTATHRVSFSFNFDWTSVAAGHYTLIATIDDVSSTPVDIVVKRGH
jgi:hypothetical protein